jgi:cysteinyl-tRNA synthetase
MKVGISLSECVRDIVIGKVAFDDVMVICARTNFSVDQLAKWGAVWDWYKESTWLGLDEQRTKDVVFELWKAGKIHQPRMFKNDVTWGLGRPIWRDLVVPPGELEHNKELRTAWDNYQSVLSNLQ